jgi:hypothetical protein
MMPTKQPIVVIATAIMPSFAISIAIIREHTASDVPNKPLIIAKWPLVTVAVSNILAELIDNCFRRVR